MRSNNITNLLHPATVLLVLAVGYEGARNHPGRYLASTQQDNAVIVGRKRCAIEEKYLHAATVAIMNRNRRPLGNYIKTENSEAKNANGPPPLTDSFERSYVPEVALLAGVAKLAYAADSKSAGT